MKSFDISGMSCASCQARVEKTVSKLPGVTECSVNLLTNSMTVEGSVSDQVIIKAVVDIGYGAKLKNSDKKEKVLEDTEVQSLVKRLIASISFLIVLMYFSMGYSMLNFWVPKALDGNFVALAIIQMLLALIIMLIDKKFFISGFKALVKKSPNMDTLVALGSGVSFIWSVYLLFSMTVVTDFEKLSHIYHNLNFESAAMIVSLITVGKALEAHSKGKTTASLKALMDLKPKTATIIKDGKEVIIDVSELKCSDIFVVKPGDSIPVDAVVIEGSSCINEAMLTGESLPVDKKEGSEVSAATLNISGYLKCKALRVGEDTTLSQIIKLVENASNSKAPIAKTADKVSSIFVPVVITISVITALAWLLIDKNLSYALERAISVLVISCPCALGLATPVAIMVGSGVGARNSILFKNATSMEESGRIKIVALDKTGTVTRGQAEVTDVISLSNIDKKEFLLIACSLESKSNHPLAKAIVGYAKKQNLEPLEVLDFKDHIGSGISGYYNNHEIFGGNVDFISRKCTFDDSVRKMALKLAKQGKTPVLFTKDSTLLGLIALADSIKEDSYQAIKILKDMGIKIVMLTGDNEDTANAISQEVGISHVYSNLLPKDKAQVVSNLKQEGKLAMVGDGINDAPALSTADVGIAIGSGTDVALDSADVVLMKSSLLDVATSIKLGRSILRNIHENLFWAFFYNSIGIPLACGLFTSFGLTLKPMFGALAMSLSSFCVVSNALRLNFFKGYKIKEDKEIVKMESTKVIKIKGMMCPHCEAHVKKALETLTGVNEALVSYKEERAVVTLNSDVSFEELAKAVIDAGYTVDR